MQHSPPTINSAITISKKMLNLVKRIHITNMTFACCIILSLTCNRPVHCELKSPTVSDATAYILG